MRMNSASLCVTALALVLAASGCNCGGATPPAQPNETPLTVTTSSLPQATVGASYSAQLESGGGAPPAGWALDSASSLPPGLALSGAGAISGTPTSAGTFNFGVVATDSANANATATLSIIVAPAALSMAPATLPGGQVSVAYSQTVTASGGTAPYTFSVASGTLPSGLSLSSEGALSGTPASAGSFTFTISVSDSASPAQSVSTSYTVAIAPAAPSTLVVTTTSLPNAVVGVVYSASLVAGGGTQPYSWSITSGSLPAGLTLDAATGAISGMPMSAGTATFMVSVLDSGSPAQSATANLGLTVLANSSSVQVTTASIPGGNVGSAYSATFAATGGTSPYVWNVASGMLPTGLSLSASGVLSGTPEVAGTFIFVVQVTDSSSPAEFGQKQFTLGIGTAPLSIVTTSLPNGVVGNAYSATIAANGGAAPYQWRISAGTLPPGLSLDAATGALSGTPSANGGYTFTVQVEDASNPKKTATQQYSITIASASAALVITTTALPDGVRGVVYSAQVSVSGGTSPYTFNISGGALPGGLSIDASTGAITGSPTSAGTFSFTTRVTDSSSPAKITSAPFTIRVHEPLQISTTSLPDGLVGSTYSGSVTATGGLTAYTFSVVSGSLPPGLSMSSTGAISGTPTSTGVYGFAVQVTDSANPKQTATANLSIAVSDTLAVSTSSLPNGSVGSSYSATLVTNGGTSPFSWSVTVGSLPPGVGLNASTGVISGTPTSGGTFSFTISVTDSSSPAQTATKALSIQVATPSALTVTTTSLPGGVVGQPYSASISAAGGTAPYTWTITAGNLPAGLSLDSTTGSISGLPLAANTSSFTIQVTDSATTPQTASANLSIVVTQLLQVTTNSMPEGTVGTSYTASLAASGGTTPYTWAIASGSLPPGLSLGAATGQITGTATAEGTYSFEVRATDSSSPQQAATRSLSIVVRAALAVITTTLPGATQSVSYSATLAASGGKTPYSWSIASGTLPGGLVLNPTTGVISGTPNAAGTYNFTVQVTDSSNPQQTATQLLSLVVAPAGTLTITTSSLPDGVTGTAYSQTLSATGGSTPYSWSIAAGALPTGLTLDAATGALSGTPTVVGTFSFTVQVTDSSTTPQTASRAFTVRISDALAISTQSLPNAQVGTAYSATLAGTGGLSPYAWSISAGQLPPGLSLDGATGVISGTPNAGGTSNFTVRLADASSPQQSVTKALSITVSAPLVITTFTLPGGRVGVMYNGTINVTGGQSPYTFAVTAGALPPGLTLDSATGGISGTPTAAANYTFTITVTDSSSPSLQASRQYTVNIR